MIKTINKIDLAKKLLDYFEWETFDAGTDKERKVLILNEKLSRESKEYKALLEVIYDSDLSENSRYEFVVEALEIISECSNENDIDDAIYNIESDIYTSNLTAWLNESNHHVYYLTEALQEYNFKDGFALLGQAQILAKQEVAFNVVKMLETLLVE
jgi:hypothetical protein